MDALIVVTKTGKVTLDGNPKYAVEVDGELAGWVFRYVESVNHSVNRVLTHVTKRRGWRFEVATPTADLPTMELRARARRLANPRITWDSRWRAVEELVRSREAIARLSD